MSKEENESAYVGLSLAECMKLLIIRACACGCGMQWKCLPDSKQTFARRECQDDYRRPFGNKQSYSWGSLGTKNSRKARLTKKTKNGKISSKR